MASKPGVVLVHGAWHSPWHFENVIAELRSAGHAVEAPALPSVGVKSVENSMAKSIAAVSEDGGRQTTQADPSPFPQIKQAIYNVTSSNRNAVVICHSMGGLSGSEAVAEFEEEMKVKETSSQHGHVTQLLYISAILIKKGTEWASQSKEPHPLQLKAGMLWHLEPIQYFYNTMDPALAQQCAAKLSGQSPDPTVVPARYCGWADYDIPVTYIACERDVALTINGAQATFIKQFEDAGVRDFRVERIDCDHTPWLSNGREEFFRVLWDVLGRAEKSSKL